MSNFTKDELIWILEEILLRMEDGIYTPGIAYKIRDKLEVMLNDKSEI